MELDDFFVFVSGLDVDGCVEISIFVRSEDGYGFVIVVGIA